MYTMKQINSANVISYNLYVMIPYTFFILKYKISISYSKVENVVCGKHNQCGIIRSMKVKPQFIETMLEEIIQITWKLLFNQNIFNN